MGHRIEKETYMKIIIETKEELKEYEEYKTLNEVEQSESIFHDKEVKIDGSLVAEEGECQKFSTCSPVAEEASA